MGLEDILRLGMKIHASRKRVQHSTPRPLNEMKHEENEKDISGKCAQEQKIVEDIDSERLFPTIKKIGYVLQPEKEHTTKKVERGANDLSHSCMTSGEHGYRLTNSRSVLIRVIPN